MWTGSSRQENVETLKMVLHSASAESVRSSSRVSEAFHCEYVSEAFH